MIAFLSELRKRNRVLFLFGWLCWLGVLVCMVQFQRDQTFVAGVNAWIKPFKFFASSAIFAWTMAWFLIHLEQQRQVKIYSWMVVVVFAFELAVITWQAANGRLSHFNISTPLYLTLYNLMGVAIVIMTLWTLWMGILFFRQKEFAIPETYLWGIRLGIIFFVLFSFEGGIMATRLSHTVGYIDGSPGIPIFNWSKQFGDLRVAHFFGIHALQIIPLVAYYLCNRVWKVYLFSLLYLAFVVVMLIQAFSKIPFYS